MPDDPKKRGICSNLLFILLKYVFLLVAQSANCCKNSPTVLRNRQKCPFPRAALSTAGKWTGENIWKNSSRRTHPNQCKVVCLETCIGSLAFLTTLVAFFLRLDSLHEIPGPKVGLIRRHPTHFAVDHNEQYRDTASNRHHR